MFEYNDNDGPNPNCRMMSILLISQLRGRLTICCSSCWGGRALGPRGRLAWISRSFLLCKTPQQGCCILSERDGEPRETGSGEHESERERGTTGSEGGGEGYGYPPGGGGREGEWAEQGRGRRPSRRSGKLGASRASCRGRRHSDSTRLIQPATARGCCCAGHHSC